jgi:hypothetical protein
MIGGGPTAGDALVAYSGLPDGPAATHLLSGRGGLTSTALGGAGLYVEPARRLRTRTLRDEELILLKVIL